jgi:hypothetical protein
MKENLDVNELKNNFIKNVEIDNAHDQVMITVSELIEGEEDFPIIYSAEVFVDCLLAYLEHREEYEWCSKLVKNRIDVESKLVPLGEFCTKNYEILKNISNRNIDLNDDEYGDW